MPNKNQNRLAQPLPADDRDHIDNLLKWSADALRRGDVESSERLHNAAHVVMDRAVARLNLARTPTTP